MARSITYNFGDKFGAKDVRKLVDSGYKTKQIGSLANQYQSILTKDGRAALSDLGISGFDQQSNLNWKAQDFGNKLQKSDLTNYHKQLVKDGFSVIGANNQLLKIGATSDPSKVGSKALNYLAGLNQNYQSSVSGGALSNNGRPFYSSTFLDSVKDSQGKKGSKAMLWNGFNQPLQITKNSHTTGGFSPIAQSTSRTKSGKIAGDTIGVWNPYGNGELKGSNSSRSGKTQRGGSGSSGGRGSRGGGGGGGISLPSIGGGGGGGAAPDTTTEEGSSKKNLSGIFGRSNTETFGAPSFRRRRSRAQRSGSFTQGPSSLGINLQRKSGLNILRA